jgi:glycolate oxidase
MSIIKDLLKEIVPKDIVIFGQENTRVFECDGLSAYKKKPLVVVLPENIEQIKQVLKICNLHNIPVITRGAGTGLSGGATPIEQSLVLGLSKFNKIKSVDVENRLAVVEPGVRNIVISETVKKYGLYYAPDPSSQIACTIGGNVAENSGGIHCLKYGLTIHNVEAIKIITIEGKEITFSRQDYGIGLLALLHGSEGLLGIIIEITVKLKPISQSSKLIMAGFNSVRDCANSVANIIKKGIIPAGLEMMDKFAIEAAENFAKVGYPLEANALLLCELDGDEQSVENEFKKTIEILSIASSIKVADEEKQISKLWKGRKSAFPAVGQISPDYYCMDGTIPRRYLADMLEQISKLSKKYNLAVANVFHAGDGNLHPLILYDANIDGELEKTEKFGMDILKLSVKFGGSITGEHGVGIEKLNAMCYQFTDKELDIFHKIKKVFDPKSLLNPGKAVPELHRCAELGAMHVNKGKLPHPEIERF